MVPISGVLDLIGLLLLLENELVGGNFATGYVSAKTASTGTELPPPEVEKKPGPGRNTLNPARAIELGRFLLWRRP